MAARSAGVGAAALGAVATLWREQALLKAAIESREIERSVLLLISPSRLEDSLSGRPERRIGYAP
jgi:hypothetical protein